MFYTIAVSRGKRGGTMEKEERIAWIGKRALEIFRQKEVALSDRLERHGLMPAVVIEIAVCVGNAISDFCRENPGLAPVFTRALLETELFGNARAMEETGGSQGNDRARDAIASSGSDPATVASIPETPNFTSSCAATRERIAEGLLGI